MDDTNGSNRSAIAKGLTAAVWTLAIAYVTSSAAWIFTVTHRLAIVEARTNGLESRISSLETGRTTPMAAETRAELNAIWRELNNIKNK